MLFRSGNLEDRLLFKEVQSFILKYNTQPTFDALQIEVDNIRGTTDDTVKHINETLKELENDTVSTNQDWLIENKRLRQTLKIGTRTRQ